MLTWNFELDNGHTGVIITDRQTLTDRQTDKRIYIIITIFKKKIFILGKKGPPLGQEDWGGGGRYIISP